MSDKQDELVFIAYLESKKKEIIVECYCKKARL